MQAIKEVLNYAIELLGAKDMSPIAIAKIEVFLQKVNLKDFIDFLEDEVLKDEYRYYTPFQKFLAISKKYSEMKQKQVIFSKLEHKQGFILDLVKKLENVCFFIEKHNSESSEKITFENLGKLLYKETRTPIFTKKDINALKSVSNSFYYILELTREGRLKEELEKAFVEKAGDALNRGKLPSKKIEGLLKDKIKRF